MGYMVREPDQLPAEELPVHEPDAELPSLLKVPLADTDPVVTMVMAVPTTPPEKLSLPLPPAYTPLITSFCTVKFHLPESSPEYVPS